MDFEINNKKEPFNDFYRIASDLISNYMLAVGEDRYRFTTLEFYYFDDVNHPDIYSHKHPLQKTTGKWYFHGSGLDITFGNTGVHGGILIRGLKRLKGGIFINGPLNCVQELFDKMGYVDNLEKINFHIVAVSSDGKVDLEREKIYYSKRFGLNKDKDQSQDTPFYNGLYRFFINPKQTQTDKGKIALDLLGQDMTEDQISKFVGYNFFKNRK